MQQRYCCECVAHTPSNPGALQARYYLRADLPDEAPLVVVLHGCTQNAAGYDHHSGWSQLADEAGFALLYPEQQRANNPNLCFNWFLPPDTTRDCGEVSSIRQMIETMVVTHGLDRKQIFVTGLSAGGAMAAARLATYPEVFAGGGIIAGLPFGCAAMAVPPSRNCRGLCGTPPSTMGGGPGFRSGRAPAITPWPLPTRSPSRRSGAACTNSTRRRRIRRVSADEAGRCGLTKQARRKSRSI